MKMFGRDDIGRNADLQTKHIPGGVAPLRTALMRERNLDKRGARLLAEATERKRQGIEARTDMLNTALGRIFLAVRSAVKSAKSPRRSFED